MVAPQSQAEVPDAAQFASKLHQAVLSLKPADVAGTRQVSRMARFLALAQLRIARKQDAGRSLRPR